MPSLRRVLGVLLVSVMCVVAWVAWPASPELERAAAKPKAETGFVGERACAGCHAREAEAWQGSHHQKAMQPATDASVLGDFADAKFQYAGIESRFFRSEGKFMVRTDGPDGALHDYAITHTFGVAPLQEYLVAFPGGRYQALSIAWDSRPREEGGQRWFHLQADQAITSQDPLHWTKATQNWNFMCADCHSTDVRKGFDEKAAAYHTTFAEISVSCEACHGPGASHVAWAKTAPDERGAIASKGLSISLSERRGVAWARDPQTGKPRRSAARTTDVEIEACARCHARRSQLHEDNVHAQPSGDDYHVALLEAELYHADGQVRGEVYEYGSFLQSKMYAAGVTCSDCHDPHTSKLRSSGNGVCVQCHAAEQYASTRHHFHAENTAAASCVSCHMTATTFMGVDARHDHSLRVPRPDLTVSLGVPNACSSCHTDRPAAWAATTVEHWYGHTTSGHQRFAHVLAKGTNAGPDASIQLTALITDLEQPAIARASALTRVAQPLVPALWKPVHAALSDASPLVRRSAARALSGSDPRLRLALLSPLLRDSVRAVRLEAAAALVDVIPDELPAPDRDALQRAFSEYRAAQALNADRPEALLSLALLYTGQKQLELAERALQKALSIDRSFAPAAVNLADLYKDLDRDREAEEVLRNALAVAHDEPALTHALGLALVRQKHLTEATDLLGKSARLAPDNARYGYVYAVALDGQGDRAGAIRALQHTLERSPYDRDALRAMIVFQRQSGKPDAVRGYEARLSALERSDSAPDTGVEARRAD